MAYGPADSFNDMIDLKTKDFTIGGKLIVSKLTIDEWQQDRYASTDIKRMLLDKIVQFILDNNLAEFTKIPDMYNGGTTYISRVYLAPNEQVKILRTIAK